MQNVSAQLSRRPASTLLEDGHFIQRQPARGVSWVLLIVAALAIGLALLYFYRPHSGRRVSATDVAAIERVIAGQDISISPLDGIPNVSVDYYDVDGTSPAAIRQELNAKGPREDGRHFDANTRWDYRWTWGPAADGSCGAANADISFSAVIKLPHLTHFAALKPNVSQAWRAYMTALAFHEAGHVRNGYDGRESLASAVRSSSCSDANAAGDNVLKRLNEQDRRYDDLTRHGANDGAVFG